MKIAFSCRCGQRLQAKDENRGKKVRCPSCHAIVLVPEADKLDSEVYSLAAASDRVAPGGEIFDRERPATSVRETSPRHTDRTLANESLNRAPAPEVDVGSTREGEDEGSSATRPYPLDDASPPPTFSPPPLPGESRPAREAIRPAVGDSKIRRLASRTLNVVGWICIAVAGLQFSVFVGSIVWSFKSGRDVVAHDARVLDLQRQITALEEKTLRKQAGLPAPGRFADQGIDAGGDVRPVQPAQPRRVDRDEEAREELQAELLRLRMSKPSEFTLTAALAMATGLAVLLFWLAATSGLLSGSLGCLLLRLTSR